MIIQIHNDQATYDLLHNRHGPVIANLLVGRIFSVSRGREPGHGSSTLKHGAVRLDLLHHSHRIPRAAFSILDPYNSLFTLRQKYQRERDRFKAQLPNLLSNREEGDPQPTPPPFHWQPNPPPPVPPPEPVLEFTPEEIQAVTWLAACQFGHHHRQWFKYHPPRHTQALRVLKNGKKLKHGLCLTPPRIRRVAGRRRQLVLDWPKIIVRAAYPHPPPVTRRALARFLAKYTDTSKGNVPSMIARAVAKGLLFFNPLLNAYHTDRIALSHPPADSLPPRSQPDRCLDPIAKRQARLQDKLKTVRSIVLGFLSRSTVSSHSLIVAIVRDAKVTTPTAIYWLEQFTAQGLIHYDPVSHSYTI